MANDYNFPISTISDWYGHYQLNPEWRPYNGKNHALHNRIFTDEEENAIAEFINENYTNQGKLFTDEDFREIAMNAFLDKHQNDENLPEFSVSDHFISDFKKRNHISSLTAHPKRRSDADAKRNQEWETSIQNLFSEFPRDRILNCDETSWQVFPNRIKTWAKTGSQNVQIRVNGNVKESITALATVAADGTKCPLYLIAQGDTDRCEKSQLGDTAHHFTNHSHNGWSTTETFKEYLHQISDYCHNQPLHLLLDLHSSHRGNEIKELAESLNIFLHYIPAGQTHLYQPLDRNCFGCVKATGRHLFRKRFQENPDFKFTKKDAVEDLIYSWEHLNSDTILDSRSIYENAELSIY